MIGTFTNFKSSFFGFSNSFISMYEDKVRVDQSSVKNIKVEARAK